MFVIWFAFVTFVNSNMAIKVEQSSCSSFHYQEQTLEKMIRLQIFVEKIKEEVDITQLKVLDTVNTIATVPEQCLTDIQKIKDVLARTEADNIKQDNLVITKMQQTIQELSDDVLKIRESMTVTPVAFQSRTVEDKVMADNKVIVFTNSMVNYNGAYDNQNGTFIVPRGGVYIFTVQLYLPNRRAAYYGIYVNEVSVQHGRIGNREYSTAYTLVAITGVNEGDRVTVRCISDCVGDTLKEDLFSTNSFSGVRIHGQ